MLLYGDETARNCCGLWAAIFSSKVLVALIWAFAAWLIAWLLIPYLPSILKNGWKLKTPWFEIDGQKRTPSDDQLHIITQAQTVQDPGTDFVLLCYRLFNVITQSQMAALEIVRLRNGRASESEVLPKYELAKRQYGPVLDYRLWVDFAEKWNLWKVTADEENSKKLWFSTTPQGEAFLLVCFNENLHSSARPF
jgi:hypothetical protein